MGSIVNIDQHKILFPLVPNAIGFAGGTNLPFTSWSSDGSFEGQLAKNEQKSVIGSVEIIDPSIDNKFNRSCEQNFLYL